MSLVYHSVVPENNKDEYVEFDNVDFVLSFPNEKIQLNTLRVEGVCKFYDETGTGLVAQIVQMDKLTGAHSFFQSIQTFIQSQSVDNIIEYPRMVKTMTAGTENPADMNNASNACELKASNDYVAMALTKYEQIPVTNGAPADEKAFHLDFSIKPMISLNRNISASSNSLSYNQTSDIRVSVQLARNENVMFGLDCASGFNYKLSELRLTYMTYPDDGEPEKVLLERTTSVQQSFFGSVAQLNFNSPILASSCFGSFIKQDDQSQPRINNLKLAKPPSPKSVTFLWNSATNEYISYELRSQTEIIENFINALSFSGKNSNGLNAIASNNGYGIGLRMGDTLDMMNNTLTVRLESNVTDNTQYVLTMFFNGVIPF